MNITFLQIFLLFNVFFVGILTAIAVRHAYAHFKKQPQVAKKHLSHTIHLSPVIKERLIQSSQAHFQAVINRSANELQRDLKSTAAHLNKQLEKLGTDIAVHEMQRYHKGLEDLRQLNEANIADAQLEIAKHQAELKTKLAERQTELEAALTENMAAEKQILIQQIDTKLADAVSSFLIETLQHNVDLGAQSDYLITMLEDHKAELIKGINNEA